MKPNRYEFMVEELLCYTITLEIEPQDCPDAEQEAAWDKFNAMDGLWYDHPTRIDQDGNTEIEIYGPYGDKDDD